MRLSAVLVLFPPVGDPARQAADREHHGEHAGRYADGAHDDAAVEIHVGIQLALDEIGVLQGDLLPDGGRFPSSGSFLPRLVQQALGDSGQDLGARIEVFIDTMTEAHEPHLAVLVLGQLHVFLGRDLARMDLLQHLQHRHVGPAVTRPPQGADARPRRRRTDWPGSSPPCAPWRWSSSAHGRHAGSTAD